MNRAELAKLETRFTRSGMSLSEADRLEKVADGLYSESSRLDSEGHRAEAETLYQEANAVIRLVNVYFEGAL